MGRRRSRHRRRFRAGVNCLSGRIARPKLNATLNGHNATASCSAQPARWMTAVEDSASLVCSMSRRRWFRPLLAGFVLWAVLQGCGSESAGPGPAGMDGGTGPDGQAGEAVSSTAGKIGSSAEAGMATGGMSAAGDSQGGAPAVAPNGTRIWLGAAVGAGQGARHQVRIRWGGPQSGRGDGVTVRVKVGTP